MKYKFDFFKKLLGLSGTVQIGFDLLKNLKNDQYTPLSEGVKSYLAYKDENTLVFHTKMESGSKLTLHNHDCVEIIQMVEGICIDLMTDKTLRKGDRYVINKGVDHLITAFKNAELSVTFQKAS